MNINEFREQRTMTIRDLFENRFPKVKLHDDCEYVHMYHDKSFIQHLSDGTFFMDLNDARESDEVSTKIRCNSLSMCEEILWNEKSYPHS